MIECCLNCSFYEEIRHRGQKYSRGNCLKHFAKRISDGYQIKLSIITPDEYICDLYEEKQRPIYVLVENETFLVPPIVAKELQEKGWIFVNGKLEKDEGE